ncbi:MAG: hypothetical protein ACI9K5_002522 [Gammaproteobacteria bacterium]|jgi:hypothetical protein
MESNTTNTQELPKEWIEREARRIALAGQVTAIRATGCEVKNAALDGAGNTVLELEDDELFAGFNSHGKAEDDPHRSDIVKNLPKDKRTLGVRMAIAQARSIHARAAALEYADLTDYFDLTDTYTWYEADVWRDELLFTMLDFLGVDEGIGEGIARRIRKDAGELVRSNWKVVLLSGYRIGAGAWPDADVAASRLKVPFKFPVRSEDVKSFLESA